MVVKSAQLVPGRKDTVIVRAQKLNADQKVSLFFVPFQGVAFGRLPLLANLSQKIAFDRVYMIRGTQKVAPVLDGEFANANDDVASLWPVFWLLISWRKLPAFYGGAKGAVQTEIGDRRDVQYDSQTINEAGNPERNEPKASMQEAG
jgi:hypothetical protein